MKVYAQEPGKPRRQASHNLTRSRAKPFAASQTEHSILYLQRTIGNQAVLRLVGSQSAIPDSSAPTPNAPLPARNLKRPVLRDESEAGNNLTVSQPGDASEREADRMAEQLTSLPDAGTPARLKKTSEGMAARHGACRACSVENKRMQSSLSGDTKMSGAPAVVSDVLASGGQPLAEDIREVAGQFFGYDFSKVRIHADSRAAQAAEVLNARAFTTGNDVVFGAGQYMPGTAGGKKLLAHELTHVVQQKGIRRFVQRAAPAIAAAGVGITLEAILLAITFVASAIVAAYLLIQAYEWARRNNIGLVSALQVMMAAVGEIVSGARALVAHINSLIERAGNIANKPPGCLEAMQRLSVLIIQFEMLLADVSAEMQSPVPRADIIRNSIQQMEALIPEIAMWARILMRNCFPVLRIVP